MRAAFASSTDTSSPSASSPESVESAEHATASGAAKARAKNENRKNVVRMKDLITLGSGASEEIPAPKRRVGESVVAIARTIAAAESVDLRADDRPHDLGACRVMFVRQLTRPVDEHAGRRAE